MHKIENVNISEFTPLITPKALKAEFDAEANALEMEIEQERLCEQRLQTERLRLVQSRTNEAKSVKPAKGSRK